MIKIQNGLKDGDQTRAAMLYWQAFGGKLGRVMAPEPKALAFVTRVLDPRFALAAYDGSRLLGIAGFKTAEGSFVGGDFGDLRAIYGLGGALLRGLGLMMLNRDVDNERFLMDGICVAPEARGRGVGTALLSAICDEAQTRGYDQVRLDVINSNPRARALYEREGFAPTATEHLGPARWLFGFDSATTMVRTLAD